MTQEVKRNIRRASFLMVGSVFLSRLLGFVREWVLAHTVGATGTADVYLASFTIPDFLNYLLAAGALNVSFIPILAEYLANGNEEMGKRIYRSVSTVLCFAMLVLIVIAEVFARPLAELVAGGFTPDQLDHLAILLRIILPAQFFFFWGGLANGVQQTHGRFIYSAIAPLIYNLGIIILGVGLYPYIGIASFSVGVLVGAIGGYGILQSWGLHRLGYSSLPKWDWNPEITAAFRRYLWMSAPIMLGFSLVVSDEWISKFLASSMGVGAVSLLSYARTEMRIPIAIIGQAAGIASYPYLSRLWTQKNFVEFGDTLISEIQKIIALSPCAAVIMLTHALPITHFIYGGGKMTPENVQATAHLLEVMGLGVCFWILQILLSRGFYATRTTWLPSILGTLVTFLSLPVYLYLGDRFGLRGLAMAGVIGISFYTFLLLVVLRKRFGNVAPDYSYRNLGVFTLAWSGVSVVFWAIANFLSQLGIYQGTKLSALADIVLVMVVIGGLALFLLRRVFPRLTAGALF